MLVLNSQMRWSKQSDLAANVSVHNAWLTVVAVAVLVPQPILRLCNTCCLPQVHVRVEIPSKLSNDERKIVEELKEIQASKPVKKKGFSLF